MWITFFPGGGKIKIALHMLLLLFSVFPSRSLKVFVYLYISPTLPHTPAQFDLSLTKFMMDNALAQLWHALRCLNLPIYLIVCFSGDTI